MSGPVSPGTPGTAGGETGGPVRRRHTLADLYHERTNFLFIPHTRRWALISATLVLVSLGALAARNLNLGIDFEGGTAWQVTMDDGRPSVADVRDLLRPLDQADAKVTVLGDDSVRVQAEVLEDPAREIARALATLTGVDEAAVETTRAGQRGIFVVRDPEQQPSRREIDGALARFDLDPEPRTDVKDARLRVDVPRLPASPVDRVTRALADYAGQRPAEVSVSTVGPTWGEQVSRKALQALLIFFALLAVYLSLRFEWKMAAAAIIPVLHDIVVTVGFYALFQFQVTPATVTAFLTILGFSLYDTVVVFDKVKENAGSLLAVGRSTYAEMVNRSLNQVLMRSLSTTLVALLPVTSLLVVGTWVLGAVTLQEFALPLLAGLFIGSYSSIFVAAPILAWWKEREPQYANLRQRRERVTAPPRLATAPRPGPPPEAEAERAAAPTREAVAARGVAEPPAAGAVSPRGRQPRRRKRR